MGCIFLLHGVFLTFTFTFGMLFLIKLIIHPYVFTSFLMEENVFMCIDLDLYYR